MTARLLSLLIWAAVLATAVAWMLPIWNRGTPVPAGAEVVGTRAPSGAGLARLLGTPPPQAVAQAAPVVVDNRFRLVGVVAPRHGQASGLALISIDGKPARSFGVGRELEPGIKLLAVSHRQAELGPARGAAAITLALPPLAEANRGRPGEVGQPQPAALTPGMPSMPRMTPAEGLPAQPLQAGEAQPLENVEAGRAERR